MEKEILRIYKQRPFSEDACVLRSKQFDKDKKFEEYVDLYEGR